MESLFEIQATEDTPHVILNKQNGEFWFKKTSIPENAKLFYNRIIDWLNEYAQNPNEETIVNFKLDYFNTSSTKYLFDIMQLLKDMAQNNHVLIFNWYFHEHDTDMFEAGQNFSKMMNFPFNFVMYK